MRQGMGEGPRGQGTWGSTLHQGLTQYLIVLPSGSFSSPHLVAKQEGGVADCTRSQGQNLAPPHPPLSECSQALSECLPFFAQPPSLSELVRVGRSAE